MRLKGHTFKTYGILALAATLFSVLPGSTAHAVAGEFSGSLMRRTPQDK